MVSLDGGSARKVDDVTASHIQDGGYALIWQRYDNNKMCGYMLLWKRYGNKKMAAILHLQQYSHRLNLLFMYFNEINKLD